MEHLPDDLRDHPLIRPGYRANVAAVIRRPSDGALWWGERMDIAGSWQFPQGGVDDGESSAEALWRELAEELGVALPREAFRLVRAAPDPVHYDFPASVLRRWVRRRRRTWIGQAQHYFLLDFVGAERTITLEPPPGCKREFRAWCWDGPSRLELAPAFKRAALRAGVEALQVDR